MTGAFFYWLGALFLALFLLTLIWDLMSRPGKEKPPKAETVIIGETPKEDWDPFKHLVETGKESAGKGKDNEIHVEVPPERNVPKEPENTPPPALEISEPSLKEKDPEVSIPTKLDDPWKALMQESAKASPSKPREIPLESDTPKKDEEKK